MTTEMAIPDHIPKGALSKDSKKLRTLATGSADFAIPLRQRNVGDLGVICSLDMAQTFLQNQDMTISKVLSLKDFNRSLKSEQTNTAEDHAFLITMEQRPHDQAAGFVFYQGQRKQELLDFAQAHQVNGAQPIHYDLPVVRDLNADHPNITSVLSRELRGQPKQILPDTKSEHVVIQEDRRFAALSRQAALSLKAAMFPGNGNIIEDIPAAQLNQRFNSISSKIEAGKYFARGILKSRWGRTEERDLTIIPGYALEFLTLDNDAIVSGFKETKAVQIILEMTAQADTDLNNKTRFRINSKKQGQLAIVERALSQLRKTNNNINVQGQQRRLVETTRERRISGRQGHIKFNSPLAVSFTLHADGRIENMFIGSGRKNALIKSAIHMPPTLDMVFRGKGYSLALD